MLDIDGKRPALIALRIMVNNHAGVMSHICGLFARRAFNMEGILVTPMPDHATSRVWILVKNDRQVEQMVRQLEKLHDCLSVRAVSVEDSVFDHLGSCMGELEGMEIKAFAH